MLINTMQVDLLEHLATFGFLSVSQFRLLTDKSVGYIREMIGSLKRKGYVSSYRIEISYKVRAENIYFLKPLAVEFLCANKFASVADIKFPISNSPVVTKDYWHRLSFITCQIHFYKYLKAQNIPITAFYTYFDKTGSVKAGNLAAKTKISLAKGSFYIPDGVLITSTTLYLIEMYCDKDSKRIINQLGLHAQAITSGTPAQAFGLGKINPLILSIFAHEGIMQAVIKKLTANEAFTQVSHLYFFATFDDVQKDISTAFMMINSTSLVIN